MGWTGGFSPDRASGPLRWLGQTLAWMVILTVAAGLLVAVLIPRITGATPYTVLTNSMEPTYPPGTLVVVKPVAAEDIAIGSVITYQLESGQPTVVTHRVVTLTNFRSEPWFRTQGDANNAPDADWVRPVQIKGEVWYSAPYLGHVNQWLTGNQRQFAVYLVAAGLLAYAAYMFVSSHRDSRVSRHSHRAPKKEVNL